MGGGCGLPLGAYATRSAAGWSLCATFTDEAWVVRVPVNLRRVNVTGANLPALLHAARTRLDAPVAIEPSAPAIPNRLVVTLPVDACEAYAPALAQAGWAIVPWELIHDAPTRAPLPPDAGTAAWIAITSPRAAPSARHALDAHTGPPPRIAALGPATARALRRHNMPLHLVASGTTGASLADDLARFPANPATVLLPQATDALPDLARGLEHHRFVTIPWPVYEMRANAHTPSLPACDALLLTSPSNAEALLNRGPPPNVPLFAFGPTTEAAMRRLGLHVAATCTGRNASDIIQVLQ
jgi:uroporphyrinogen-III synthase